MWLVGLTWIYVFYENLLRTSDSVIIPQLMTSLHANAAGIGMISSASYFAYVICLIPAGLILDRYPLRLVFGSAVLVTTIGCFIFSLSHNVWVSWAAQLIMGFGSAFAFPLCVKVLQTKLQTNRLSFWIGIIMTVITLGDVTGQAPWYWLVHFVGGWRAAYVLMVAVGLLILLLAVLGIDPELNPRSQSQLRSSSIHKLMQQRTFWILAIFIGVLTVPVTGFIGLWAIPFMSQMWLMTTAKAASLAALLWVGGLFGGPILGWLADYFNIRYRLLFCVGLLATVLTVGIIYWAMPIWLLGVVFFILGAICNANVIVFAIFAGLVEKEAIGVTTAIATMFDMVGGPIFQVFVGYRLSHYAMFSANYTVPQYQSALVWMSIILIVSTVSLLFLKRSHGKEREALSL